MHRNNGEAGCRTPELDATGWRVRRPAAVLEANRSYALHTLCSAPRLSKEYRPCPAERAFSHERVHHRENAFDARGMLELLGGNATITFLGDSLVRQQFQMLSCMLSQYADLGAAIGLGRTNAYQYMRFFERGKTLHLKNQWISGLDEFAFKEVDRRMYEADVVVFGIGAFIRPGGLHEALGKWRNHFEEQRVCARFIWLQCAHRSIARTLARRPLPLRMRLLPRLLPRL